MRLPRPILTALLVVTLTVIPASPIQAHDSDYCGHGSSGWSVQTIWIGTHEVRGAWHLEEYEHRRWGVWKVHENVFKWCHLRSH